MRRLLVVVLVVAVAFGLYVTFKGGMGVEPGRLRNVAPAVSP
jgi:hypothetical protein